MKQVQVIGLEGIPEVRPGDNIVEIILNALSASGIRLDNGDIIAITEKIVSKAEGRLYKLDDIQPSKKALELSNKIGKDPRIIELVLRESKEIIGFGEHFIIVETKQGFICANGGVDQSNVSSGMVKLLPKDPDESAYEIRTSLEEKTGKKLGVIIVDSWGRPFRYGTVGFVIGASGITVLWDRRGHRDLYNRRLEVTRVAVGDALAAFASLIFGEANEGIPCAVIKGLNFLGSGKASDLLRDKRIDIFRR